MTGENPNIFTFVGLNKPLKILAKNGSAFRIRQSPAVTVVEYIFTKTLALKHLASQSRQVPIDADYYRKESDFASTSVGYLSINQLLHSLEPATLIKFID